MEKRAMSKSVFPVQYCAGVAGHVTKGESYDEAAVRETEEETGIKNVDLNFVCKINFCPETLYEFPHVYETSYDGEIKFDPTETESIRWLSISEVFELAKKKDMVASVFVKCLEGYVKAKVFEKVARFLFFLSVLLLKALLPGWLVSALLFY